MKQVLLLLSIFVFYLPSVSAKLPDKAKAELKAIFVETKFRGGIMGLGELEGSLKDDVKTILVSVRDGLPVGPARLQPDLLAHAGVVEIEGGGIVGTWGEFGSVLKKGELLAIGEMRFRGDNIEFDLVTINPHSITRGVGAFAHQEIERARVCVRFMFPKSVFDSGNVPLIQAEVEKWFKVFPNYYRAVGFGNTMSGVFVPEVKIGMSVADVEKILGPPEKKFTFPDRVVYKYKDFTVEFKESVVTDIKF